MTYPCQPATGEPKPALLGPPVVAKRVDERASIGEIFTHCMTAYGGAYVSRFYQILREAIRREVPLIVSIAGPITLADQHRAWLIPMIERGWIAYLTVTDAICYHDGHDSLEAFDQRPIGRLPLFGDDKANLQAGLIRVTDVGFHERILLQQDKMITAVMQRPEFQRTMTTTERNYLLGQYYEAQEQAYQVRPGLLSTCYRHQVPVFVGAAADGSAFLNSVKLWARSKLTGESYRFGYDLHADVFESCAYHYWGLFKSKAKALAILILGGGVPKNYSLQPEPTLSQVFLLDNIRGYDYDVQIVSAPVTDGSLSGCPPAEAVTWGKISPKTYQTYTESVQADYTTIMPFVAAGLLSDHSICAREQLRLYAKRSVIVDDLLAKVGSNLDRIDETLNFELKLVSRAKP